MSKIILTILIIFTAQLISADDVLFIGIAGGSGSGKTTLAKRIKQAFGADVVVIEQDAYYKDLSFLTEQERDKTNFDHPSSLDFVLLKDQLLALKQGETIQKPIYDFKTHTRKTETHSIEPRRVVIVEGILLLAVPEVRELFDLKIFVDNHEDIRLLRRIQRDIEERGRDFASVRDQYLATVKPMHARYVEPSKWFADVIIPGNGENRVSIDLIISKLQATIYSEENFPSRNFASK